jgi:hypothetical protein
MQKHQPMHAIMQRGEGQPSVGDEDCKMECEKCQSLSRVRRPFQLNAARAGRAGGAGAGA